MTDGSKTTIDPGMSYTIPPGHDAWVEGNEPFMGIEVMSAEEFAKARRKIATFSDGHCCRRGDRK